MLDTTLSQDPNLSVFQGKIIVIDCRYICDRPSGISPYVQALVDHVPTLVPGASFVFLKHPKAPAQLSTAPNVREIVFPYEATGPATMWLMRWFVDWQNISLFHATFNIQPAWVPVPVVTTIHDVMWVKYPHWARRDGLWGHVETAYYQHGIHRALQHSVRLAAISQATLDEIASLYPSAATRTHVTHYGVSPEWRPMLNESDEQQAEIVKKKWLPGAERFILTVGQYAPYKNHKAVLRAFAKAFGHDASVHLGLVQRLGPGAREMLPLVTSLGLDGRVHFLKDVPFDELRALFWGAIALCHPSLYEGFGNPPSEALGAGCPIVTSNRSSMPEVSGDAAILVNPEHDEEIANALYRIAKNPELADQMRQRGLERVERFRWKLTAQKTVEMYQRALEEKSK